MEGQIVDAGEYSANVSPREKKPEYTEGVKFDQGKPRIDLFPPEALLGISEVLAYGAAKYADRNWEKGMSWGRVFAAVMRHGWKWWMGEKVDKESGLPHLWHMGCGVCFLIAYEERQKGTDDRYKP